jgi:hypothetical protein
VATVHLNQGVHAGQELDVSMKVADMAEPVELPAALRVAPPRPRILNATMGRAQNLGVEQRRDEMPADLYVTYSLRADRLEGRPAVRLSCTDTALTLAEQNLRAGEKSNAASFDAIGSGALFLSILPAAIGEPGCLLQATVEVAEAGSSDPYNLGHVTRLPQIDKFTVSDEKAGDRLYVATIEGEHLETIGQVGWDATHGIAVDNLPTPVPGDSHKQTLRVTVSWPTPAPQSPLYIWLQGEKEGRLTQARY